MTSEIDMTPPDVVVNVEAELNGFVLDENGRGIPDALVSVFNKTSTTNEFGFFELTALMNQNQTLIKVEKTGYFDQFKSLIPSRESVNRTRIHLKEKEAPQTLSSQDGGTIIIFQETKVSFQANSFIDDSGNPYNGEVNVYSYFIDPTDPNLDRIMPGSLLARNLEDEQNLLKSFGMVNVVLEGSAGQQLDINKPATLTVEVPSSLSNSAPSEIPLWFFDEEIGTWKEEGSASLSDGKYVGTVNHFTFWNCDVPLEKLTLLSGQVTNEMGVPVVKVRITEVNTGFYAADWTDLDGTFEGYVPRNTDLLLEILDECGGTILHSEAIGPYSEEEVDIGTIEVLTNNNLIVVSGTLVDCEGDPVSNGQVLLSLPGQFYPSQVSTEMDGSFSIVTSSCGSAEIEITAIDYDNSIISDPMTFTVSTDMTLGDVQVCGGNSIAASVTFIYDNVTKIIPNVQLTIIPQTPTAATRYKFEFIDENAGVDEAPANYAFTFIDVNNDLNNPSFSYIIDANPPSVIIESVSIYGALGITDQNTEVVQEANAPGDIMSIEFTDCLIGIETINSSGDVVSTAHEGTVIFSGELQ